MGSSLQGLLFDEPSPAPTTTTTTRAMIVDLLQTNTPFNVSDSSLWADWLETPLGAMLAVADEAQLHLLEFVERKALPKELERLREHKRSAIRLARNPILAHFAQELAAYFAGHSAAFSTPLAQYGTPFARTVWQHLLAIPPATTQSYRDLAHSLGQPTALRAVARANGANQIAIVVPCHRVIGHDGSLTGYAGGLWRKQWLLEHERRHFQSASRVATLAAGARTDQGQA